MTLATALQRLESGELASDTRNDWRWDFASDYRMTSGRHRPCADGCPTALHPEIRARVVAGTRWAHLVV
jgi:hypothetical protein